jgi:hypothetical protein
MVANSQLSMSYCYFNDFYPCLKLLGSEDLLYTDSLNGLRLKFVEYGLEVFQKRLTENIELNSSYMRTVEIVRCCVYEGIESL